MVERLGHTAVPAGVLVGVIKEKDLEDTGGCGMFRSLPGGDETVEVAEVEISAHRGEREVS